MDSSPLLFTVLSSSPVNIQFDESLSYEGLGIACIHEMNPQRLTAMGRDEVERLGDLFRKGRGLDQIQSDIWAAALYTSTPVEAADIQPYSRPQRGNTHLFSMVGELPGVEDKDRFPVGDQWPISCTDQERAFCLLQERMRKLWTEGRPDHEMRLALLSDYSGRLDQLGSHNFIYWDGEMAFAYSSSSPELEPLSYQLFSGSEIKLDGCFPLTITAKGGADIVIIAAQSLLPEGGVISPGSVFAFSGGRYVERCDPVVFWND